MKVGIGVMQPHSKNTWSRQKPEEARKDPHPEPSESTVLPTP